VYDTAWHAYVTVMQTQVKEGHSQLEEMWESRRQRLELSLQLRVFEHQSLEVNIIYNTHLISKCIDSKIDEYLCRC
jgi:hypothetical protein